jgi:hypothetical protein
MMSHRCDDRILKNIVVIINFFIVLTVVGVHHLGSLAPLPHLSPGNNSKLIT